jgi:hypothetical protein
MSSWLFVGNNRWSAGHEIVNPTRDDLFTRSGNHIGRVQRRKVFGPDGRYVGTLAGDRLVYRSTDSAHVSSAFGRQAGAASSSANAAAAAVWGEEPRSPD